MQNFVIQSQALTFTVCFLFLSFKYVQDKSDMVTAFCKFCSLASSVVAASSKHCAVSMHNDW